MPVDLKSYKIFIASPGGLQKERVLFRDCLDNHNNLEGFERGVHFRAVGWEDTLGGVGRPQGIINLEVEKCDYFLLLLHDRWGSNPGSNNGYTSGTEEEFHMALKSLNDSKMPMKQIVLLFKDISPAQLSDPGPQLSQVLAFRKEREEKKDILYTTFDNDSKFSRTVSSHLARWVREHEQNVVSEPKNKQKIASSITTTFKSEDYNWIQQNVVIDNLDLAVSHAHDLYSSGKILEADFIYSQVYRSSNNPNHAVEYGKFLRKRYKLHHAEEVLLKSIELANDAQDRKCLAYAIRQLGRVYEFQGKIGKAQVEFQKAYDIYDDLGDLEGLARTNMDMGFALSRDNDPDQAIKHLERALGQFKDINHRIGIGECLSYLGLAYKDKGDFNKSEEYHLKALAQLTSTSNVNLEAIAVTKGNLGVVKRLKNEYSEAQSYHQDALEFYMKGSDLRAQSREYSNLGVVYRRMKKYDDAILMHEKALELEDETLNEKGRAIQLGNLGLNYLEKRELDKSEQLLNQSLKISIALNDVRSQAIQFKHFAKLAMIRNEFATAETFIQKSLRIDIEGTNRFGEAEAKRLRGDLLKLMSKDKDDESWKLPYREALDIYKELRLQNQINEMRVILDEK